VTRTPNLFSTYEQISKWKHRKYEKARKYDSPEVNNNIKKKQQQQKDLVHCEGSEISIFQLKIILIRMVSEMKKHTDKQPNETKENVNKQLTEFKGNTNKKQNELRKIQMNS
jgi:hypothetical protein